LSPVTKTGLDSHLSPAVRGVQTSNRSNMATQHSRVYGHPVHAREPSANISSEEELLETMSADSDSSTDALGMSEHMEVQGMLRRADWLHEQSERQVCGSCFASVVS
jgi:hypothetical protein